MQTITTVAELKSAIEILEFEHSLKGQIVKEQVFLTYESLKPINLIRSTMKEVSASPYLTENVLGVIMGVSTGYLSKKLVVGSSSGVFKKLLGSIVQFGVTNIVAQNSDKLKSIGESILQNIFTKKDKPTI